MTKERWTIWLAKVKFENSVDFKDRPIVIMEDEDFNCTYLYVTSKIKDRLHWYNIEYWEFAKLDKPSMIRLNIKDIAGERIVYNIGKLHEEDIKNLMIALGHGTYCSSYKS